MTNETLARAIAREWLSKLTDNRDQDIRFDDRKLLSMVYDTTTGSDLRSAILEALTSSPSDLIKHIQLEIKWYCSIIKDIEHPEEQGETDE